MVSIGHCFCGYGVSLIELICQPPIKMQTRMQGTKAKQYANTIDCFKQIVSQEGVGALYAGVVPRLGRVVPGQGIIFMSFEAIVQSLEQFSIFQ